MENVITYHELEEILNDEYVEVNLEDGDLVDEIVLRGEVVKEVFMGSHFVAAVRTTVY